MQRVVIHIKGKIDRDWKNWLGDLEVSPAQNETVISGIIRDQAALRGILNRIADLGIQLISVAAENTDSPE